MAELPEIPELNSLRGKIADIPIASDSRVLLISSPTTEAVFATTVLGRAIIRSGGIVHITFIEPAITSSTAASILSKYTGFQPLFIGVSLSTVEKSSSLADAIFLAPSHTFDGAVTVGATQPIIPTVLALAGEKYPLTTSDLRLAAIGLLITKGRTTNDSLSSSIIDAAMTSCGFSNRPEYLLYGANFMPARECLSVSIYPYMEGISGDSNECDLLLKQAEITPVRRTRPLVLLKKDERQRITSAIIERIDPALAAQIIGPNVENLSENEDSPMRWVSNIRILAAIAWARREFGLGMAVWMGDRARSLKVLLDSCMDTTNRVIMALHEILPTINENAFQITGSVTHMTLSSGDDAVLTEVGRILLERGLIQSRFLGLQSDTALSISWCSSDVSLSLVLSSFEASGLNPFSTSSSSIVLDPTSDWQTIFATLETIGEQTTS
ncbi:MAG: hypothetical protein ACTSYL_05970 [Candidatus Thorarchaeota archaeon]